MSEIAENWQKLRARIARAEQAADRVPGSVHLLAGLSLLGGGIPFTVLKQFGLTADSIRTYIGGSSCDPEPVTEFDGIRFGASAVRAVERATQEARAMSHSYTGIEHVLLGLLSEESGSAVQLFKNRHVDPAKVRETILKVSTNSRRDAGYDSK